MRSTSRSYFCFGRKQVSVLGRPKSKRLEQPTSSTSRDGLNENMRTDREHTNRGVCPWRHLEHLTLVTVLLRGHVQAISALSSSSVVEAELRSEGRVSVTHSATHLRAGKSTAAYPCRTVTPHHV
ncbi:hypothetical protein RRG08_024914 [Elysia crispata]|uniref:Uncharacterized protein n=1 Tax=Elysia crispata TaxID=231223 RepID=A0AAE1A0T1_9GAST|nr:hypothetical protein RRG08_024914 [Elysia crispata]